MDDQLPFPTRGVDLSTEFQLQPELTTPVGENVVSTEPGGARRTRGGSRQGTAKWIDSRPDPGNFNSPIQELAIVVSADPAALGSEDVFGGGNVPGIPGIPGVPGVPGVPETPPVGNPDPTTYPPEWPPWPDPDDPRFPHGPPSGPPGGSGTQPSPETEPPEDPATSGWVYQQSTLMFADSFAVPSGGGTIELEVPFPSPVGDNQLLVIGVVFAEGDVGDVGGTTFTGATVTDTLGNTWAERASVAQDRGLPLDPPFVNRLKYTMKIYSTVTNAGSCTATITASYTNSHDTGVLVSAQFLGVEYTGLENASPFEGSATDSFAASPGPSGPVAVTAGNCPVGGNTRLAVGMMFCRATYLSTPGSSFTVADGFTQRRVLGSFLSSSGTCVVWIDDTSTGVSSEPRVDTPAYAAGGPVPEIIWLAANASFRFGA